MIKHMGLSHLMNNGDFAAFGVPFVAYVKRVEIAGGIAAYAVHGADGEPLGIEASEDMAALSAKQKNLMPVMVQ